MKLLSLIDRTYFCIHSFILKTPSKDMPIVVAASFMAIIAGIHVIALLSLIQVSKGISLSRENTLVIVTVILALFGSCTYYYYVSKKNGEKIIRKYKGVIKEKTATIIGAIVFFETVFLPLALGCIDISLSKLWKL